MSNNLPQGISVTPPGGKILLFRTPAELDYWLNNYEQQWSWLQRTPLEIVWNRLQSPLQDIRSTLRNWSNYHHQTGNIPQWQAEIQSGINRLYTDEGSLLKNDAAVEFVLKLFKEQGPLVAAGAYATLTKCSIHFTGNTTGAFFEGIIQGFLFDHEIEWVATAHRTILAQLEAELKQHISNQSKRLEMLESANKNLNDAHDSTLKEKVLSLEALETLKSKSMDELHQTQNDAFDGMLKMHKENIKATEEAFHNKLALSKPIDYWTAKREKHKKLTSNFARSSIVSFIAFALILGLVVNWAFGNLTANENPKHWQIGVVIVATFFAVWIIRIQVRFLFSNQHLASDADERVTMVQTYLSLLQEGKGVETNNRALIVQQLFRPASDGIVKDDAAPPGGIMEMVTRQK